MSADIYSNNIPRAISRSAHKDMSKCYFTASFLRVTSTVLFHFSFNCIYLFFILDRNCFVDKKEAICMVVFLSVLFLSLLANVVLAYLCEYPYVLYIAACYMHFTFYYYYCYFLLLLTNHFFFPTRNNLS